jgi:hypothetical protein
MTTMTTLAMPRNDPHVQALQRIFTQEIVDKFMWGYGYTNYSVMTEVSRFVSEQIIEQDLDSPSTTN